MSGPGKKRPPLVADQRFPKSSAAKKQTKAKATPNPKTKTVKKRASKVTAGARAKRGILGRISGAIGMLFRWILRLTWRLFYRSALVVALLLAVAVSYFYVQLPPVTELIDGRAKGSVTILDRYGETFAWRGDQFGGMVTADMVSPNLKNAVVAVEDKRFYRHLGISPRGIASAVRINLREGRGPLSGNGGSTLTQQTAKLLCLGVPYDPSGEMTEAEYEADCRQGTIWRKIKEAVYALSLEARYTKDEILTVYLNRAFLGAGARGFEAASQRYFGKPASDVSAAEGAMLAGLLVAPTRYAPTRDLELSQNRAGVVVGLMENQGYLTASEAATAIAEPATLSAAAEARAGGYFADWVMDSGPSFLTRQTTEDVILQTTLDPEIQTAAEEALAFIFESRVREGSKAEAAIVVMSSDGAVRAMVGGRRTKVSGAFNRATMAKRQTGSAFKPFVYATALDLGYSHADIVDDAPLTLDIPGSGRWSPKNYTGKFLGPVTLTDALKNSLNIPAVRISEAVGRDNVRKVAADFGIESDLALGPALALGASEASLLEMTGAYAGILNGGRSVTPYGLIELKLLGEESAIMGQTGGMGERVISPGAAEELVYMMHQVIEGGSGKRARLSDRQAAGKTGTTQAARDAWFLGFTADYVAGVWMGFDDNTPLTGVTGGGLPAAIWRETMTRVHEGLPARPLPMIQRAAPPRVVQKTEAPRRNQGNRRNNRSPNRGERILIEVLREILGANN